MADLIKRALGPSIQINAQFPLNLEAVMGDVNQLEMALLNLVVNARDAMPDGGTITILAGDHQVEPGAGEGLAPGRYVGLKVIDDGVGMDAATLARAMEPFFTTKGIGKGTGLGLSMVHGLAEQSGGRFLLESKVGEGTTATLLLPVAEAPAASLPREAANLIPSSVRQLTVLAVDDDSLVLMNTAALLEDLGHKVHEALSGEEALRIVEQEQGIDLVITDQAMPSMTGIQLAERIRAGWPDMPIIVATGYGELPVDTDVTVRKLGKPFGQPELARAVDELFRAMLGKPDTASIGDAPPCTPAAKSDGFGQVSVARVDGG
jgi:CheY-like chemotaxis protein